MRVMHTLILATIASAFTLASQPLLAHGDEHHDTRPAAHGGQLRVAGVYWFELAVTKDGKDEKENAVIVYVTDHAGTRIPTAGASGSATILAGKNKVTATLAPDGENRLKGTARYASTPDMKVVLSITFPGKAAEQARFTPLTAVAAATADKNKH